MAVKIITTILVLSILVPFAVYFIGEKTYKKGKRCMLCNIAIFFTTLAASTFMMFSGTAFAEGTAAAAGIGTGAGLGFLAAGLATGLSSVGAGIAVAAAASTAIGAISEDPKLMGKSLIFVALAEGIALYGLLVSFSILARL